HGRMRAIGPPAPGLRWYFAELWRHRPAMRYYFRRYVRKRTQRTFLGYLWFVIPIVLPLIVGTLVFGSILGVQVGETPYFTHYSLGWLLFLTPVIYPVSKVPSGLRILVNLNPVTAPLEMVKHGVLGSGPVTALGLVSWAVTVTGVGLAGLYSFARKERQDL